MNTIVHTLSLRMANVYMLESELGLMLVDAGMPWDEKRILEFIKETSEKKLQLIYITHAHLDHFGAAGAIKSATGAPVVIHQADAVAMSRGETRLGNPRGRGVLLAAIFPLLKTLLPSKPVTADIIAVDNQDLSAFGFPARIIHTPGHTPGSSTLLLDEKLAFVGDLLINTGKPHVQRLYATDWSEVKFSLRRLISLEPTKIYTGHGRDPISGDILLSLSQLNP